MSENSNTDRILPLTRWVAVLVIPFLVLAFIILYFFPQLSGQRFAWEIKPSLTALYMGAGYLGGSFLFLQTVIGRRWHRVAAGFPAVTAFTISMLLATLLHWDRFDISHLPFQIWLVLYVVTPFLVPWLWWRNRSADDGLPEPGDVRVPQVVRWGLRLMGIGLTLMAVAGIIAPQLLIKIWPWTLTPLTARVLAGWEALIGIGNLVMSLDVRWSSWRNGAASIAIWHILFLVGSLFHQQEFNAGAWLNWFTFSVMGILLFVGLFFFFMERKRTRDRR